MRETQGPFHRAVCNGFTLVELLVVIVILSILASLTLTGLNVGRHRAKIDRTKATIRKIDAVIQPMYEDYLDRSVPEAFLPVLMAHEMPDRWRDVITEPEFTAIASSTAAVDQCLRTGAIRAYSRIANSDAKRTELAQKLTNAECLYLCVTRSGYEPDALEAFRPDEVGDLDGDGAREFLDGWGKPIFFLRWAPGFSSPFQVVSGSTNREKIASLTPLIYSGGLDESANDTLNGPDGYALKRPDDTVARIRSTLSKYDPVTSFPDVGQPSSNSAADNITNHGLTAR
jgi:prepilin-type N-terminal cleavage/methylation domain-containing protein